MDIHGFSQSFRPFDLRSFVGFLRLSDLRIGFAQRQETTPKTLAISTGDWVASRARKNAVKAVKPMEGYISRASEIAKHNLLSGVYE